MDPLRALSCLRKSPLAATQDQGQSSRLDDQHNAARCGPRRLTYGLAVVRNLAEMLVRYAVDLQLVRGLEVNDGPAGERPSSVLEGQIDNALDQRAVVESHQHRCFTPDVLTSQSRTPQNRMRQRAFSSRDRRRRFFG